MAESEQNPKPINAYDSSDVVRRHSVMRAGGLKIALYDVLDIETGERSSLQVHMTMNDTVLCVMPAAAIKLAATFIESHKADIEKSQRPGNSQRESPSL